MTCSWCFSTELNPQLIGQHTAFDPTKSATFKKVDGAQWNISYGDGSGAAGVVGRDTVTIGGVTVKDQAVELANQVSQSFVQDVNTDGLMGLAFSKLNTSKWTNSQMQCLLLTTDQSTTAPRRLLRKPSSPMS